MRICAIVSCYNESDILGETISSLIKEGVDVYVLDNNSTDSCLNIAESYINKGVIGFERISFLENGREVYNWAGILNRKESLAKSLGYDWYIHADADEVRLSPWGNFSLSEAIERVDREGFNLINFKLFNFRLYDGLSGHDDILNNMTMYSNAENYNSVQLKAWKSDLSLDLVQSGGHRALLNDAKIYPIRFILKHYPIRSLEQGVRKINSERKSRYSISDRKRDWHVQYDHFSSSVEILKKELFWSKCDLKSFKLDDVRDQLRIESEIISSWTENYKKFIGISRSDAFYNAVIHQEFDGKEKLDFSFDVFNELIDDIKNSSDDEDGFKNLLMELPIELSKILRVEAGLKLLEGEPWLFENINL